jgi:hypothetical protein
MPIKSQQVLKLKWFFFMLIKSFSEHKQTAFEREKERML